MQFENTQHFARVLDNQDEIKDFRNEFVIPVKEGKEQVYFLGNSLGLQPKQTALYIQHILNDWGTNGVESFFTGNDPWMHYHDHLTTTLSILLGTKTSEVVVMNNLTVNLHLMMVSFYRPQGKKNKILCEAKAFPSDQYMLESHVRYHGFRPEETIIEVAPRVGEHCLRTGDILARIEEHREDLALILFGGVNYYTGEVMDIKAITEAGHNAGARVGFDLAHAVGNISLQLHNWDVDFACWCNYKYLNSGPGAIGGAYIHERYHTDADINRFAGWWGYKKETRFKMEKGFLPITSAEGWQLSTPPLTLLAAHRSALDIIKKAGWENIQQKAKRLTAYLWFVLKEINASQKEKIIEFITPEGENKHGCQISLLMLQKGKEVYEQLMKKGVYVDWREPNVIRLAPVPLYNTFEEVWKFGNILHSVLQGN
ncbi:MAG TPA: kynureninase [Chitinophagaceae bacterium]|nr:kynureninase [Chitinophagaceae bacterium]